MKPIPFILILALLLSVNSDAQISTTGLVAQWNFSGNVADSSGNGHHGTIHGTVVPDTGKNGIANSAMLFTGAGNYVSVPHAADFNFKKYSICAIVKHTMFFTGTCQGNAIIVRGPAAPGHWGVNLNDNAYNDCQSADTNKYVFTPYAGSVGPAPSAMQYSPSTRTNTWYCVVATYDSVDVRLYINGQLKITFAADSIGSSTDSIGIGADLFAGQHTFPFTGLIDEIRVYSRVLDSTEINYFCTYSNKDTTGGGDTTNAVHGIGAGNDEIRIYPNPASAGLVISADALPRASAKHYVIYNMTGQAVITGSFTSASHQVNITSLPAGAYYINIRTESGTLTRQVIVQ
jgi:hypothetical protein